MTKPSIEGASALRIPSALLESALDDVVPGARMLRRRPNRHSSRSPSEIITCRLADGQVHEFLCKYSKGAERTAVGTPWGPAYEAEVYRLLAGRPGLPVAFRGFWSGGHEDRSVLFLDFVADSVRLGDAPHPESVRRAAAWLGRFHRVWDGHAHVSSPNSINRHDLDYYMAWVRRVESLAKDGDGLGWIAEMATNAHRAFLPLLDASDPTMIHGEFYPENILVQKGTIWPVDWEWAAIGPGEIDLISLVENWSPEIADLCRAEYVTSRWSGGAPPTFDVRLRAAEFYVQCRSLGGPSSRVLRWTGTGRTARLKALAMELGLL